MAIGHVERKGIITVLKYNGLLKPDVVLATTVEPMIDSIRDAFFVEVIVVVAATKTIEAARLAFVHCSSIMN